MTPTGERRQHEGRPVFTLTVTGKRDMNSQYGSLTLYKFRDADGRTACWFSGAP